MKNDYLEYYGEHSISPVKQNISDFSLHLKRRKKLYRQCGMPVMTFRGANILEIGPGGGYNTLAFFQWDAGHVDLVEPNPQGIKDMRQLFAEYSIPSERYSIFDTRIEDYKTDKRYDIVIAEGFLPYLYNQQEVINKLQQLVNLDGIIVVTCSDDVCMFIEAMKRLVGIAVSADIKEYDKKVAFLSNLFKPQLSRLRGVSRSVTEWVQDQILNPAGINGMELSLLQAIEYFGNEFEILGSSPNMFTDYSWYKDIWYDYKGNYKEQFRGKRLSLLQAGMEEVIMPINTAEILADEFKKIKRLAAEYEKTLNMEKIERIIEIMDAMYVTVAKLFDNSFISVFVEIRELLNCIQQNAIVKMDRYPHFFEAFGRTQQYISFVNN